MPRLSASSQHRIRFALNGRLVWGFAEPRMLLSDFIRHVIGATGTHVGCEHGVCGACTVQIDGAPARSCIMLAVQAEGADMAPSRASPRRRACRHCKMLSATITAYNAAFARRAS
jgi:2-furoyl-CoA dehydrogenase 2Fe-2S iron sulfur subunit